MKVNVSEQNPPDGEQEATSEAADGNTPRYLCMKYNRHQQGDQATCQDPDLYCKFRPSCLIHYLEKRRRRDQNSGDGTSGA